MLSKVPTSNQVESASFKMPTLKKKNMIFTDFDNTLYREGEEVAMNAFLTYFNEELALKGDQLIISTGGRYENLKHIIDKNSALKGAKILATRNGSEIYHWDDMHNTYIKDENWDKIVRNGFDKDSLLEACLEIKGIIENKATVHNDLNLHFLAAKSDQVQINEEFNKLKSKGFSFQWAFCRKTESEIFVDLNSENSGKGNALIHLTNLLEVPIENTIAFGDSLNDIPMLLAAGKGFIVANCCSEMENWFNSRVNHKSNTIFMSKYQYGFALLNEIRSLKENKFQYCKDSLTSPVPDNTISY